MKFLHIVGNDRKFIFPLIPYINENFDIGQHKFLFLNATIDEANDLKKYSNTIVLWPYDSTNNMVRRLLLFIKVPLSFIYLLINYLQSNKIFIHGLFDKKVILFLFVFNKFLKRSAWIMWGGGDLDSIESYNCKGIKKRIERIVKSGFAEYITYVEDDYKQAEKMYGAKGKYKECLVYKSNVFNCKVEKNTNNNDIINILVGNSADAENNHLEILDKIKKYKEQNIKIYCILSYAEKPWTLGYKSKVIEYGREIFGEKFIPITDFMTYDAYIDFLRTIDIAIFDHKYQQAMGNTINLLGLGKKVYLRDNVPHKMFLNRLGITTYSSNDIVIDRISKDIIEKNTNIVRKYFSEENLKKQWLMILN